MRLHEVSAFKIHQDRKFLNEYGYSLVPDKIFSLKKSNIFITFDNKTKKRLNIKHFYGDNRYYTTRKY